MCGRKEIFGFRVLVSVHDERPNPRFPVLVSQGFVVDHIAESGRHKVDGVAGRDRSR
jgi:hypothetical protein